MNYSDLKIHIKEHCLQLTREKINTVKGALNAATESANNETKSTAGDKYETGKAMMQLEQEKLGKQLQEMLAMENEIGRIDLTNSDKKIKKGSLIETDKGWFFIGIGYGKISVNKISVFTISENSPVGKKFLSLDKSNQLNFNSTIYNILSIH